MAVSLIVAPGDAASVFDRIRDLVSRKVATIVQYRISADNNVLPVDHTMAADLRPGAYTLTIGVRNLRTGALAERQTLLWLQ